MSDLNNNFTIAYNEFFFFKTANVAMQLPPLLFALYQEKKLVKLIRIKLVN